MIHGRVYWKKIKIKIKIKNQSFPYFGAKIN
jgi:hypothetical protein